MADYKTPGVYTEEVSTLPPSVASVSTAIPAFIGYTTKGFPAAKTDPSAVRVSSMLEFETLFGGPVTVKFKASVNNAKEITISSPTNGGPNKLNHLLHYSLSLYFANGGGPCYVVSIGEAKTGGALKKADFTKGLEAIQKKDEPTLIVLTDAVKLSADDYHVLCQEALAQCGILKDRLAILDVLDTGSSNDVSNFRGEKGVGMNNLEYGAAYFPYLKTSLSYYYEDKDIDVDGVINEWGGTIGGASGLAITYNKPSEEAPEVVISASGSAGEFSISGKTLTILGIDATDGKKASDIVGYWADWKEDKKGFEIKKKRGSGNPAIKTTEGQDTTVELTFSSITKPLSDIKSSYTADYNAIKLALEAETITLPPSAAIAGVYARTDRERGVWKAPANVSLAAVLGPQQRITDEEQKELNVDATAGKSINAIRSFQGKGTLVWGARTLAGNDNEWRYISVRRLFNTIEESTQKATSFAVFEANEASTWLKVQAMIGNYLHGLWQQGALAGSAPELAYYVEVGLGKTMTPQDVLEGRMNIEIGIAAVRPAEFIILKFSHKMQEA